MTRERAGEMLKKMLLTAGVSIKASYHPGEVCAILAISSRTFLRMTNRYVEDPETGLPMRPDSLKSFTLSTNRRVDYEELVSFLERNNTYHRRNAVDPRQLSLFK